MVRSLLIVCGLAAIGWSHAVIPVLWSEKVIVDVATAILAGEGFKPAVLASIDDKIKGDGRAKFRSAVLSKAAAIRLRLAEEAGRGDDTRLLDSRLGALRTILDQTFEDAPADSFLWLARFWVDANGQGVHAEDLPFLRMSYALGPYEGWIATKRNGAALTAYTVLPSDLADRAVIEFVDLVRSGFIAETASIAAGTNAALRRTLFAQLADVKSDQRKAFASAFYAHELDDVPVPGFPAPAPPIQMPVVPPGF